MHNPPTTTDAQPLAPPPYQLSSRQRHSRGTQTDSPLPQAAPRKRPTTLLEKINLCNNILDEYLPALMELMMRTMVGLLMLAFAAIPLVIAFMAVFGFGAWRR